jgi:type II restriction/modification system DNA methylase subunit YeeA
MNIQQTDIKKSLSKQYRLVKPKREDIEKFKKNLCLLLDSIDESESEENVKIHLMDFLKNTWYSPDYLVAPKGRTDFVIHTGKTADHPAGVLFEVKRPANKTDMINRNNINEKAFQELVLYYLRERENGNDDIRRLVITNIYEWFVFDARNFERIFYGNSEFVKQYERWLAGQKVSTGTDHFYNDIARKFIEESEGTISFTYFDLRDYDGYLRNELKSDDNLLIPVFKALSPVHQLKLSPRADSNDLDKGFYTELLHIIGLEEVKDGGNKVIRRKEPKERSSGSLLENTMTILKTEDCLRNIPNLRDYGDKTEEQLYNTAFELCITWINRIVFLKLLEAQLVKYHGSDDFRFLSIHKVNGFDALNKLFFQVLAQKHKDRSDSVNKAFGDIPYMNSSLFETSELESATIRINSLDDDETVSVFRSSILNDVNNKPVTSKELPLLDYLFRFLDSYDFASEGGEEIQEESKSLINASVLGLIFEKINGYKDGSIYTPGFITMHICRETIRRAVVKKFNDERSWKCESIDDVKNFLMDLKLPKDILSANKTINSIRVCDPAVGSGHFLVSALNEFVAVKSELGILADEKGNRLTISNRPVTVDVDRDELVIAYNDGEDIFEYKVSDKKVSKDVQRVQKTIFHEKQTIIENCLFGVDINANSVKICRLRLWIELLKNAYYTEESGFTELETLPNIDINIKEGNSLLSRFALDEDMREVMKKSGYTIAEYRTRVNEYKDVHDKQKKHEIEKIIGSIKEKFREGFFVIKEINKELTGLESKYDILAKQGDMFESAKDKKEREIKAAALLKKIEKVKNKQLEVESNERYRGAFEWRFEFPEVLADDGTFSGFDVVVGNPPYIRQEELGELKKHLEKSFEVYAGTADILVYFIELGVKILKAGGEFSFITANKFMRAGFGAPLREYLAKLHIHDITDFGDLPVFDEVTTYPCILALSKNEAGKDFYAANIETLEFDDFSEYLKKKRFRKKQANLKAEGWSLSSDKADALLDKIKATGVPLGEYVNGQIYYGIKTGLNEAFVIDAAIRDALIKADKKSAEIIKPFLAGRDVKRYGSLDADKFLILLPKGITDLNRRNLEPFNWLEKTYPAVAKHLKPFESDAKKRYDKGDYWWELRACDYYAEFEKPKIICPAIVQKGSYLFDNAAFYSNDKTTIIASEDLYLLANLNSKVADFVLHSIASTKQGGFYEYKPMYISMVPIFQNPPKETRKQIISLVESMLALNKKRAKETDTAKREAIDEKISETDREIDALVYELYGLDEKEIRMVEKG